MSEVTTEDAKRFLGEACRNWSYLRFNKDDLEDVRASLQRHREAAVAELRAENERLRQIVGSICISDMVGKMGWKSYKQAQEGLLTALSQKETSHDD